MRSQLWSGNTWEMFILKTATKGITELRWLLRRKAGSITGEWKCFMVTLNSSTI